MPEPERLPSPARTFIRPAPAAPYGLAPMAFAVSFRIRFAEAKTAVKHHRPMTADGRLRVGADITVVPRAEVVRRMCIYRIDVFTTTFSSRSNPPMWLRLPTI